MNVSKSLDTVAVSKSPTQFFCIGNSLAYFVVHLLYHSLRLLRCFEIKVVFSKGLANYVWKTATQRKEMQRRRRRCTRTLISYADEGGRPEQTQITSQKKYHCEAKIIEYYFLMQFVWPTETYGNFTKISLSCRFLSFSHFSISILFGFVGV